MVSFNGDEMTIPVVVKPSGKIVGIRGLYMDVSSGRYYVRASFHGIDKQVTIFPKKTTFSGLKTTADKEFRTLKTRVKNSASLTSGETTKRQSNIVATGITELDERIRKIWSLRCSRQMSVRNILRDCKGLALCSSKRSCDISLVENHNNSLLVEMMKRDDMTQSAKSRVIRIVTSVFRVLIDESYHHGINPGTRIPIPKKITHRRKNDLTLEDVAKILKNIEASKRYKTTVKLDLKLFLMLCIETGQRPWDVYFFDPDKIDGDHYWFESKKTNRTQRVEHKLSKRVLDLVNQLIQNRNGVKTTEKTIKNEFTYDENFSSLWSGSFKKICEKLNSEFHALEDKKATLYNTRHLFVTEIFKQTESAVWSSAFTHDGENSNQKHYLHLDQQRADEIMDEYIQRFESLL